jgi:hypothetical protein
MDDIGVGPTTAVEFTPTPLFAPGTVEFEPIAVWDGSAPDFVVFAAPAV